MASSSAILSFTIYYRMDWLSNIVYGRKRRNQSEEKETDVMFFGLGPDDSLNGSVESFKFDDEKDRFVYLCSKVYFSA